MLLLVAVWGCCRAYYFAFYVIDKHMDPVSVPGLDNTTPEAEPALMAAMRELLGLACAAEE